MKIFLIILFLNLFSIVLFAQEEQEKTVFLSSKKFKERIIKQEFPDVPQNVRDCHAQGTFTVLLFVNEEGNVTKTNLLSGICKAADEYVEKTVANWKFKPLEVDEKKAAFRGILFIQFCYGGFSCWCCY